MSWGVKASTVAQLEDNQALLQICTISHLKELLKENIPIIILLSFCWLIEWADVLSGYHISSTGGIQPHDFPRGFLAILWSPFIHASIGHLIAVSFAFTLLGTFILKRGLFLWITLFCVTAYVSGVIVWFIGHNPNSHLVPGLELLPEVEYVGLSPIIYGYLSYLIVLATLEGTSQIKNASMAVIVFIIYAGLMYLFNWSADKTSTLFNILGLVIAGVFCWIEFHYRQWRERSTIPAKDEHGSNAEKQGLVSENEEFNDNDV